MPRSPRSQALPELNEQLVRWTAAALIDPVQARQIAEHEAARAASTEAIPGHRRLPLVAEVLGYVGAVVAVAALVVAVRQFWPHVPAGVQLAFAGTVAVLLTAAGGALRTAKEPAAVRLRSVLWLLATGSAAAFVAILGDRFLRMSYEDVAVITTAAWTACAIPLWWRGRTALLQLSLFAGSVAVVETSIDRIVANAPGWEYGLGLWVLSMLWGAAAWRGYLTSRTAGLAASGSGVIVGAIITTDTAAGVVFALATVAGVLAAGIVSRRVLLLGLGAAGLIYVVPDAAGRYLPGSPAAPLAVALVGLLLLAVAIWLARSRARSASPPRP